MATRHRLAAAFTLLALLTACSSKSEHEAIATELAQSMEEFAGILDGVKDEAGAKAALPKLETVVGRMKEVKQLMEAAGEPSAELQANPNKDLEARVTKATQRMMQAMMQLAQNEKVMAVLGPVLEKMDK